MKNWQYVLSWLCGNRPGSRFKTRWKDIPVGNQAHLITGFYLPLKCTLRPCKGQIKCPSYLPLLAKQVILHSSRHDNFAYYIVSSLAVFKRVGKVLHRGQQSSVFALWHKSCKVVMYTLSL